MKLEYNVHKMNITKQKDYINYGLKLYKNYNCDKYFILPEYHLKNLYQKQKKELHSNTLSEIFNYSYNIKNLGEFCRGYEETFLYNNNNVKFNHKHMIFYLISILKIICFRRYKY